MRMAKFSIRGTLLGIIALLNILIAGQAGYQAWHSWNNYQQALQVRFASQVLNGLYTTQKFLSQERGASMAAFDNTKSETGPLLAELRGHRASAEASWSAVAKVLRNEKSGQTRDTLKRVHASFAELKELRRSFDAFTRRGAGADSKLADRMFAALNKLISDIAMLIEVYSGENLVSDAALMPRVRLARSIWSITEYTGREYALLGRTIVAQRNPTQEEIRWLSNWQGRIESGWDTVDGFLATSQWGDSFKSHIDEAKTQYYMTFEQIKEVIYAQDATRSTYPLSIEMWLGLSSQALDSLYDMMDASLELNRNYIATLKSAAERGIGLSLLLFATVLVLSIYSWHVIIHRVIVPINMMVGALYRATRGEPAELPAVAFGDDEVGKLATVLDAFKDNARQLQEERDKARAASLAKSEFLANMSHEIRTPMNVVLGIANILSASSPLTERQKEFVRTLRISAESLLGIINDLLDISKIETGSFDLEQIPFSLKAIIDETALLNSVKAREKGLALDVDAGCLEGREYIGDPTRLRQILTNLCSNAVKFTHRGRIGISVTCSPGVTPGVDDVFISVSDTGVGIPKEKRDIIFEKFTQADSSINRKFGGTGLGLSIAKAFADMMNGDITVESEEGRGTTFTIYLPLRLRRTGVKPAAGDGAHAAQPALALPKGQRVLLVEDYAPNALVAGAFLEQFGYSYDVASNGQEALQMAGQSQYHAILMDVQMQVLDGYQATQAIRQLEEHSNRSRTRIIGMTAYALPGDRDKCLAAGMDDYIAKPFKPDELREKLGASSSPEAASVARKKGGKKQQAKPKTCRVLVVDDNEDSAKTLGWSVEALGHEVRIATDGPGAIEAAQDFTPDVILLDIGLPQTDGYKVCRQLRKIPAVQDARIIAQTGWGDDEHRERSADAGFDDHLVKPVTIDMLRKVLPC